MGTHAFPEFYVVGAAKAGTTLLYGMLRQHPDVFLPDLKETHFFALGGQPPAFADEAARRMNATAIWREADYLALYAGQSGCRGEICASYLAATGAAERIAAARPDAKIVILLRDPIRRAFSAYRHMKARGAENAPDFEAALRAERAHIAQNWQLMAHYLAASRYHAQVAAYFEHFPAENILVVDFADLTEDPAAVADAVQRHIGVAPRSLVMRQTNRGVTVGNAFVRELVINKRFGVAQLRKCLPKAMRAQLRDRFIARFSRPDEALEPGTRARLLADLAPDIDALEALLGRRFPAWRR